jgi:hypothetical protein
MFNHSVGFFLEAYSLFCSQQFCRFFFIFIFTQCADPSGRATLVIYDPSLAGIVGLYPAGGMDFCLFSSLPWSEESDGIWSVWVWCKSSTMRGPWSNWGCLAMRMGGICVYYCNQDSVCRSVGLSFVSRYVVGTMTLLSNFQIFGKDGWN